MPFESLGAVSYSPSIVTVAVSVAVCEIFSVKEWRDLENQVIVHSLTHSLTAALDQLRVVASSTSNDPGPRSRQHQQSSL